MPAVMIRQLEALTKIMRPHDTAGEQRAVLLAQADMILQSSKESVPEPSDRADVRHEYEKMVAAAAARSRHGVKSPSAPGATGIEAKLELSGLDP